MGCSNSNTKDVSGNGSNQKNKVPPKVQDRVDNKSKRKGGNCKTLNENPLTAVNESALQVTTYFQNQEPPSDPYEPWTDDIFNPNNNSVFSTYDDGTPTDPSPDRVNGYRNGFRMKSEDIKWARAKDIFEGGKFVLFENTISVDDIRQGSLGNCYLMSAISALAETPQLILQLFRDQEVKENGCYEIVLRIDGEWQVVLVDDWFPVDSNNKPVFCKPVGAEIWVMLLEKAWAKINGGYTNCIAGIPSDVLQVFTNFPCKYYTHTAYLDKKDEFWKILLTSSNNNDIATSSSKGGDDTKNNQGVVSGHAFSLFCAKEGTIGGKKIRLLQIRNPWGNTEWKGKWSDSSKEWTSEAKKVFGNNEVKDDGCFWMEFDDYLEHFYCTEISFFHSPQVTKTVKINEDDANNSHVIEFTLYNDAEVSISAVKPHWRTNRGIKSNSYLQINTLLLRKNENANLDDPESCFSFIGCGGDSDIRMKVSAGTYLVYSNANFEGAIENDNYDKAYPYRVQIGASDFFDMTYKGVDYENIVPRLGLIDMIKKTRAKELKKGGISCLQSNAIENTTLGYYFFQNDTSEDYNFVLNNACQNMKIVFPISFDETFKVLPGRSFVTFGPRQKTYASFLFWFTQDSGSDGNESINSYPDHSTWVENTPTQDVGFVSGFIFKQLALDVNNFCQKIDPVQEAYAFYKTKYPELMEDLESLQPFTDGVKTKIMDKYTFPDGSYYFAECKIDEPFIKHGRMVYQWANGSKFVGYSKLNKFNGEGTMYNDGNPAKCLYNDGVFSKWL